MDVDLYRFEKQGRLSRANIIVSLEEQHVGGLSHTGVSLKFHHAPGHSPQPPFR